MCDETRVGVGLEGGEGNADGEGEEGLDMGVEAEYFGFLGAGLEQGG